MNRILTAALVVAVFVPIQPSFGKSCGEVIVSLAFQKKGEKGVTSDKVPVAIPNFGLERGAAVTDEGTLKALWAVNFAKMMQTALKAAEKYDGDIPSAFLSPSSAPARVAGIPLMEPDSVGANSSSYRERLADAFLAQIGVFAAKAKNWESDAKISEAIVYAKRLADLIRSEPRRDTFNYAAVDFSAFLSDHTRGGGGLTMGGGGVLRSMSAAPKLRLTAGGAQDYGQFRAKIDRGDLPSAADFDPEGFLRSLDLPLLNPKRTTKEISAKSGIVFDPTTGKLFVQLELDTKHTPENFVRDPLNLVVALDISGSMSENDGTSLSRLEWAKVALAKMLDKLDKNDRVSVVVYDHETEVLIESTAVTKANKEALLAKIQALNPRGATNIKSALERSRQIAQEAKFNLGAKGGAYEHRVILLTDAGHNTGAAGHEVVSEVGTAAQSDIGLTVIGIGEQLEPKLAQRMSTQKGGNYIFVNSGDGIERLFDQFEFLVSPIVSNLKMGVEVEMDGQTARLHRVYGANAAETGGSKASDIVNIPTLFLASPGGGGTILLEFNLLPKEGAAAK